MRAPHRTSGSASRSIASSRHQSEGSRQEHKTAGRQRHRACAPTLVSTLRGGLRSCMPAPGGAGRTCTLSPRRSAAPPPALRRVAHIRMPNQVLVAALPRSHGLSIDSLAPLGHHTHAHAHYTWQAEARIGHRPVAATARCSPRTPCPAPASARSPCATGPPRIAAPASTHNQSPLILSLLRHLRQDRLQCECTGQPCGWQELLRSSPTLHQLHQPAARGSGRQHPMCACSAHAAACALAALAGRRDGGPLASEREREQRAPEDLSTRRVSTTQRRPQRRCLPPDPPLRFHRW